MNLHPQPFAMIANGTKTIELRLYDEKRRRIRVGDSITFVNTQNPSETVDVSVVRLHLFPSFQELYKHLPLQKCGYRDADLPFASPSDMNAYYSAEQQQRCGVVGIEIKTIS